MKEYLIRDVSWKFQEFRRFFLGFYLELNPSIIDFKGRRIIAFRDYQPVRSYVRVGYLNDNKIINAKKILGEKRVYSAQDPRFFVFNEKLHLSYTKTGWSAISGWKGSGKMAYCELDSDLNVVSERVFNEFAGVHKNWLFFEGTDKKLYSIIYTSKQEVLDVDSGEIIKNENFPSWDEIKKTGGERKSHSGLCGSVRGGTTPILIGNEYFSFFHVTPVIKDLDKRELGYCYEVGLYSFESTPPFQIKAYTPKPLLIGDPIVMPYGAIYDKGKWIVSCGVNDRSWALQEFDHTELLKLMKSV